MTTVTESKQEWHTDEEGRRYRLVSGDQYRANARGCTGCSHWQPAGPGRKACPPCGADTGEDGIGLIRDYADYGITVPTADLDGLAALLDDAPTCISPEACEDISQDAGFAEWFGRVEEAVERLRGGA